MNEKERTGKYGYKPLTDAEFEEAIKIKPAASRKAQILACFDEVGAETKVIITKLVDEMVFLEEKLAELRQLPQIAVNPKDRTKQVATAASRTYASFISRYADIVNRLCGILKKNDSEEDSPLRAFTKCCDGGKLIKNDL